MHALFSCEEECGNYLMMYEHHQASATSSFVQSQQYPVYNAKEHNRIYQDAKSYSFHSIKKEENG